MTAILSTRPWLIKTEFRQSDLCADHVLNCRESFLRKCTQSTFKYSSIWKCNFSKDLGLFLRQRNALLEQQCGPRFTALTLPWNLLAMQIHQPYPEPPRWKLCGPFDLCCNRPSRCFWHMPKFKNYYSREIGNKIKYVLKVKVLVAPSCLTLCHPPDCSPSGSSAHGILQARVLEWVAISFSRGSFRPRDGTSVSCIADKFFTVWTTKEEAPGKYVLGSWNYQAQSLLEQRFWLLTSVGSFKIRDWGMVMWSLF